MYCNSCGTNAGEARFCPECGISISSGKSETPIQTPPQVQPVAKSVITNLKNYDEHIELTCLECGYKGLMGVTSRVKHRGARITFWTFFIFGLCVFVLIFGGGSILFGAAMGLIGMFIVAKLWPIKTFVMCPSCNSELGPIK